MSFKSMLNKQCVLETASRAHDNDTGEISPVWSALRTNLKCRLRSRSFAERITSGAQYVNSTHVLYIEYIEQLELGSAQTRVLLDGVYYEVIGASGMGGEAKYLCLYLERKE